MTLSPKYFDAELTGSAGSPGLVDTQANPAMVPVSTPTGHDDPHMVRRSNVTHGTVRTITIPTHPITASLLALGLDPITMPENALVLGRRKDQTMIATLAPQGVVVHKVRHGSSYRRTLSVRYLIEVLSVVDDEPISRWRWWTWNPGATLAGILDHLDEVDVEHEDYGPGATRPAQPREGTVEAWLARYSLRDALVAQAASWESMKDDPYLDAIVASAAQSIQVDPAGAQIIIEALADQARAMSSYPIALEAYHRLHATLVDRLDPDLVEHLCMTNLHLLLARQTHLLSHDAPMVPIPVIDPAKVEARYSPEQRAAILAREPAVLVTAGAGTGKSTLIGGRLRALSDTGVPADDIMVLSFTNAAADHISATYPGTTSSTIASMVKSIYDLNHPSHRLAGTTTVTNCLEAFFPGDDIAMTLCRLMRLSKHDSSESLVEMIDLVADHHDHIVAMLDRIGQTTLELQVVMCYDHLGHYDEPESTHARFLIVDEVQDTSIFEFVFLLAFARTHHMNTFFVGDPSQTLYEFRGSNPKAIGMLESSGVFATYRLTVNYRSDQEVLDFANATLADIEANRFAKIQLVSHRGRTSTAASFADKVRVKPLMLSTIGQFPKMIDDLIDQTTRPFVQSHLDEGKQVCFMVHSRQNATRTLLALQETYPDYVIESLIPDKDFESTAFSTYVKKFWINVCQVRPIDASFVFRHNLLTVLDSCIPVPDDMREQIMTNVAEQCSDWYETNKSWLDSMAVDATNGSTSREVFFTKMRDSILDYEIRNNAIHKLMNTDDEEELDKPRPDIVVSTIHSVKGLEFDSTVVMCRDNTSMNEDDKRMYYVAFTRAMDSTMVVAYTTAKTSVMAQRHAKIVDALP